MIQCTGSNVFIVPTDPIEANTVKGIVTDIGSTGSINVCRGNVVYYSNDDVLAKLVINGVTVDVVVHWRIFGKEVKDEYKKKANKESDSIEFAGFGNMAF